MKFRTICLASLVMGACVEEDASWSSSEHEVESANALTANQLSANGMSLNGMSMNKLAVNGMSVNGMSVNGMSINGMSVNGMSVNGMSVNGMSVNGMSINGMSLDGLPLAGVRAVYAADSATTAWLQTAQGRHVFSYLARCALNPDTMVVAQAGPTVHGFRGSLGIYPTWVKEPLTAEGKAWLSGCMLAHVNAFGVSVPISIRGELGALAAGQGEPEAFPFQEGAFFGDLFAAAPKMYGCLGWDARDAYGDTSPYLKDRACISGTTDGETSRCGFVNVGACEAVCENLNHTGDGLNDEAWEDCNVGGRKYPFVVTTFLPGAR